MQDDYIVNRSGVCMAILQVRDIDDHLYDTLKAVARQENRSVSQEVISILEQYLAEPSAVRINPTREFLALSGSWSEEKSASELTAEVRGRRRNSRRFGPDHGLFD